MQPIKWLYFLHLSNQDIGARAITLAFNWVPFQYSKINKYEDHFFIVLFMPYNKSFIDQASSVKMAGYWPSSLFTFLWTSTSSRSIKTQKENSANIQPSWPRTWSIIYTYHSTSALMQILHFDWLRYYRSISNSHRVAKFAGFVNLFTSFYSQINIFFA